MVLVGVGAGGTRQGTWLATLVACSELTCDTSLIAGGRVTGWWADRCEASCGPSACLGIHVAHYRRFTTKQRRSIVLFIYSLYYFSCSSTKSPLYMTFSIWHIAKCPPTSAHGPNLAPPTITGRNNQPNCRNRRRNGAKDNYSRHGLAAGHCLHVRGLVV